jgi:hypothetical protein
MEELMTKVKSQIGLWLGLILFVGFGVEICCADKLILKDGTVAFGTISDERDSLIRYLDRFDRPRKIVATKVDTIHYDSKQVLGLVKVAFRTGQAKDRSGYFQVRHSEELDLDVEYHTDSVAELDLFFRNNMHVRVLPRTRFRVTKAPKSLHGELIISLYSGSILTTSPMDEVMAQTITPWGIVVGRGKFQTGVVASETDSSTLVMCQYGLVGLKESAESPGELVVEDGQAVSLFKKEGVFNRREPDPLAERELAARAANMGHYLFSEVEYPKLGYLPKAITGLGFMVFFYGTAIGILDYVNHI